jgi:predicted acyltransferase
VSAIEPVDQPRPELPSDLVGGDVPAAPMQPAPPVRLRSLDALRGFDMFWIIGGGGLIFALQKYVHTRPDAAAWQWLDWLAGQLEHPPWNGFKFYDLIFPLFLFISGVTMPFSIVRRQAAGEASWRLHGRIARRAILLVVLGMVVNGCLKLDWANARYPSVLGRIGLAYFFAGLIVLHTRPRGQFVSMVLILLGYCAAVCLIPVPNGSRGVLDIDHWLGGYIDQHLLPGKLYRKVHDPEGLLATIPAVATALMGAITGAWLRWKSAEPGEPWGIRLARGVGKVAVMAVVGAAFLKLGKLWDPYFPINKNMWTSSFVLYAGGWSLLFLSAFYLVIDVFGLWWWAFPFIIIGLNPITIYVVMNRLIDFKIPAHFLFDGVLKHVPEVTRPIWWSLSVLLMEWLFLYVLYRKKMFLRV